MVEMVRGKPDSPPPECNVTSHAGFLNHEAIHDICFWNPSDAVVFQQV